MNFRVVPTYILHAEAKPVLWSNQVGLRPAVAVIAAIPWRQRTKVSLGGW